ncbi:MAG: hypothetical protein ACI8UO_000819 [Verrucomicrobiales bacterium]|jgi:hypothetical protein
MAEKLKDSDEEQEPGAGMAGFAGLGCSIAALMFIGLAIWTIYVGISQNAEIAKFAEDERKSYPIDPPSAETVALLETKLKILAIASEKKEETVVELSVDEFNGLIMTQPLLADFRGLARIAKISSSAIEIQMSQEVRKLPFGRRYVNGTYYFKPNEIEDIWLLRLLAIDAEKGPVNQNYIEMFSKLELLRFDAENPNLRPVLKQLKSVKLADGKVVFTTWKGDPPKPEQP